MATNKKPHKYKGPSMDIKTRIAMEAKFRKENENARIAGMQYGTLAMGVISLMATIACSTVPEIRKYMIDASAVLADSRYIPLNQVIDTVNEKMGSSVTADQIVEVDPSFGAFF